MQRTMIFGIGLIALGTVYLFWPTIFRRWFWMRTSIAVRVFSEENYKRYMRGFGAVLIIAGVALVIWNVAHRV